MGVNYSFKAGLRKKYKNIFVLLICMGLSLSLCISKIWKVAAENESFDNNDEVVDETEETVIPIGKISKVSQIKLSVDENNNKVTLSWDAPLIEITDLNTNDQIDYPYSLKYMIYRKTNQEEYKLINTTENVNYVDNISGSTFYRYKVKTVLSIDNLESGMYSNESSNVFLLKNILPPSNFKIIQSENNKYTNISWNKVPNATGYQIYKKDKTNVWRYIETISSNNYTDKDVKYFNSYQYKIRTYINYSGKTQYSNFIITNSFYVNTPKRYNLNVANINQYKIGYNMGCEIVALSIIMKHLKFKPQNGKQMTDILYKKYTKKGNYNLNKYYYGNPKGNGKTRFSYGAGYEKVIRDTANRFLKAKKSKKRAHALKGKSVEELYKHIVQGRPVIVWATEYMKPAKPFKMAGGTWHRNAHTLVLTGYDKNKKIVYMADPERGKVTYPEAKFRASYNARGKRAVVIY